MGHRGFPPGSPTPVTVDSGYLWLHGLFVLLMVVALVVGTVLLVRVIVKRPRATYPAPLHPALAELDFRYARGEIERPDYLQRRADLINPAALGAPLIPAAPAPTPDPPTTPT